MFEHVYVEADQDDEPYADQVRRWFLEALPGAVGQARDKLELVFEALLASGKIRYGPRPSPESQVAIREVLRFYIDRGLPVPVLVPWGSEKPDETGIDIAEVAGLRTLYDLNWRVTQHYQPGVAIRIRVEDASAPHLFWTRQEQSKVASALYTSQFVKLAKILGPPIVPVPESTFISADDFSSYADGLVPDFERYIVETDLYGLGGVADRPSYKRLLGLGWAGVIPAEQRDYYRNTYAKLYGIDPRSERATHTLARYMAEAIARGHLGITGVAPEWKEGGWVQVSLVPPVPGAPIQRTGRTVYYRTMPENITSNHIPPWRAKGYLEAQEDGTWRPKLTTVRALPPGLHEAHVTICGIGGERVDVRADYSVAEPR